MFSVGHREARRACPEGAMGLSPGFQPWEPNTPERRALKGRQTESIYNAQVRASCSISQLRLLILRNDRIPSPLHQGESSNLWYPGLKPWAKPCSPFGAGLLG
jgi:hypothetical protein